MLLILEAGCFLSKVRTHEIWNKICDLINECVRIKIIWRIQQTQAILSLLYYYDKNDKNIGRRLIIFIMFLKKNYIYTSTSSFASQQVISKAKNSSLRIILIRNGRLILFRLNSKFITSHANWNYNICIWYRQALQR